MVFFKKMTGLILVLIFLFEQAFSVNATPCILSNQCLAPSSEIEEINVKKLFLSTLIDAWVHCSANQDPEQTMDWKKIHYYLIKNGFDIKELSGSSEKVDYVTLFFNTLNGNTQSVTIHFDRKGKNLVKPKISFPPDSETFIFGFDEVSESMDSRIFGFLETPVFNREIWMNQQKMDKEAQKNFAKNSLSKGSGGMGKSILAYVATFSVLAFVFFYAPFGLYALVSTFLIASASGLITMAETALISTTRDEKAVAYLQRQAEKGNRAAEKALALVNKTYSTLPTITLTKNFVGVPGGIMISDISNSFLSRYLENGIVAKILDRFFAVIITLIFSEQIPKDMGSAEKKALIVMAITPVFPFFEKVLWPFIAFLHRLNRFSLEFVSALFFLDRSSKKKQSAYAKKMGRVFESAWLEGTLSDLEYNFLDGILALESTTLGELFAKRGWSYTLFSLPPEMKISTAVQKLGGSFFSSIPLIDKYGSCHQVVSKEAIFLHAQKLTQLQKRLDFFRNRKEQLLIRLKETETSLQTSTEQEKLQNLIEILKRHINLTEKNFMTLTKQITSLEIQNLLAMDSLPHVMIGRDQTLAEVLKLFLSENPPKMGLMVDPHNKKPLGIVTLEDIMEFLFQQEIFDETDIAKDSGRSMPISQKPMELISNTIIQKNSRLIAKFLELKKESLEAPAPDHSYDISRFEKELEYISSVRIGFLFDLLWSDAFADRKIQPFIYSCNMESYHFLAQWFERKKEYADLFSLLKKSFNAIKDLNAGVPASHNFHQIYNDFFRLIRYAEIGNPQRDPRTDFLIKNPILEEIVHLLMIRDPNSLKNNLIRLKEMSRIVEDTQGYRPQTFYKKIQPFLTFGMIATLIGGILAAAFMISPLIGHFVLVTLVFSSISGMITGMEVAIFSVNRETVENLSYTGDPLGLMLKDILDNRQKYIPTTSFFNTLVKIPGGIFLKSSSIPIMGEVGSWFFSTLWFTIFVKVIPKFLGVRFSLPIAKISAPALKTLRILFFPVVALMENLTLFFKIYLKALSLGKIDFMDSTPPKQSVEIYNQQRKVMRRVFEAEKARAIADEPNMIFSEEKKVTLGLLEKGLDFFGGVPGNDTVADILNIKIEQKSFPKIFDLPSDISIERANTAVQDCPFSRILLYDRVIKGKIHYIGCVFKKDILQAYLDKERRDAPLSTLLYTLVPKTSLSSSAKNLLKKFLAVGTAHLSIVEDTKGNPVAVLSLEDIMKYMLTPKKAEIEVKEGAPPAELTEMISSFHPEKQAA